MHKRILVIFVALVLLVCICAIPAAAAPADEDLPYIELMDFTSSPIDGTMLGSFYVMDSYDFLGLFGFALGEIPAFGYEITYSYVGNRPDVRGVSFGSVSDNSYISRYIEGTNIGKVRGSFGGAVGSDFGISFWSSGCYVTIHSFRVFLVENFQIELSADLYGNGQSVYWTPGSSSSVSTTGYGSIEIDSWRNFDVINVSATLGGYGITSVSARLIDNTSDMEIVIPFDLNYINLSDYDGDHENVLMTVSCDMRGVDPATAPDSTLIIGITTAVPSGSYGYIQPTSIYGSILIESTDKYLPWIKYIAGFSDSLYSDISASLPSLSSDIYTLLRKFELFTRDVSSYFTDIKSSFADLKTYFTDFWDNNILDYKEWLVAFENNKWSLWYSKAFLQLSDDLKTIHADLAVDQTQKEEVQQSAQGMTSAGSSLSNLGAEMDSYTPSLSVDDISFDATSLVPALGMASAGTLASIVTSDPLVASMLLIVATLALVAFVLFGKR